VTCARSGSKGDGRLLRVRGLGDHRRQ
jgi:hypothetical protein